MKISIFAYSETKPSSGIKYYGYIQQFSSIFTACNNHPSIIPNNMSFSALGLPLSLLKALENQNYLQPYPIQQEAIPAILKKRDVLGIAKTGSGKTAGYVLPILMNLQGKTNTKNRHVNVLVLVPTRELAMQVSEVFITFGAVSYTHLRAHETDSYLVCRLL